MILRYFSKYLQDTNSEATFRNLVFWLKNKLETPAKCHEDKIIQAEIYLAQNTNGTFCLLGKSETGRTLVLSLYNYILSYQNLLNARQKHSLEQRQN